MKKIIVLLSLGGMLLLVGCGGRNNLVKTCNDLTKVGNYLNKATIQAQVIHAQDPNAISDEMLDIMEDARMLSNSLAGSICTVSETLQDIDKVF